jgi:hypothetical protein
MQPSGNDGSQRADPSPELPQVKEGNRGVDKQKKNLAVESETEVKLDESAQTLIGHHLKAVYREIVDQPIPDQFLKLLEDLERKERGL